MRTARLVRGLREVRRELDAQPYCTAENRREKISEVFHNAYSPVFDAVHNAADTLWSFLFRLWYDFVGVIVFLANLVVKGAYYVGSFVLFLWDKLWDLRIWADARKKTLFQIFASVIAIVVFGCLTVNYLTAYEYSYYGRTLGTAKTTKEVYDAIALIGDKLSESAGVSINFDVERDIEFKKVFGINNKLDSKDEILNTITYMKDIHVTAYAIQVDGVDVAYLDNEAAANSIIEDVKTSLLPKIEGMEYDNVTVGQEITVAPVNVTLGSLWRPDDAAKYLKTGFVRDLESDEDPQPLITVSASGTLTWDEYTAYYTNYITDNSLYLNQVVQVSEGQPGINRTTAHVEIVNGVEVARTDEKTEVIAQPVNSVYRRGTKEIPASSGTGTWMFPLKTSNYHLTSGYGWRPTYFAGMMALHQGNDFGCDEGTPIYASDGGTVLYAGYQGTYGNKVEITHGNGYTTIYAHCSAIVVGVGQTVEQGQLIAYVGHTGAATGPHLHFETRFNGIPFNSLDLFN